MLQAMNTGHDGSISTLHANSARDALSRVENMVMMGHVNLPARAIRAQMVSALDLIIQVERMRDGVRRVTQVAEIRSMEGDVITMNDVVKFEFSREDVRGQIIGEYKSLHAVSAFVDRLEYFGLKRAWNDALQEI